MFLIQVKFCNILLNFCKMKKKKKKKKRKRNLKCQMKNCIHQKHKIVGTSSRLYILYLIGNITIIYYDLCMIKIPVLSNLCQPVITTRCLSCRGSVHHYLLMAMEFLWYYRIQFMMQWQLFQLKAHNVSRKLRGVRHNWILTKTVNQQKVWIKSIHDE